MALKLMYITNNEDIAKIAEDSGVDWIFIDLEINGKEKRQGHLDTIISRHNINDVYKIKKVLKKSKLLVRVNPIFDGSKGEIEKVIQYGADIVMLPFFKNDDEVKQFINYINGRAETCLLWETPDAVNNIDSILSIKGIDYCHIGLNDLHLGYKKMFMFELLYDGTVEMLCSKFKYAGISYGFGGIARLGCGDLRSEYIISEHYRLGSSMAILSRSFYNTNNVANIDVIMESFNIGIKEIRSYEKQLELSSPMLFNNKHDEAIQIVLAIREAAVTKQ